jgi:hypothetical protein
MKKPDKLRAAMKSGTLVRFSRRFEDSFTTGYVLAVRPKWFMLLLIDDRVRFNGYSVLRIADTSKLQRDPFSEFVGSVLKKRKQKKPRVPQVDLSSTEKLLSSIAGQFSLVTIHTERIDPSVCYIGRIRAIAKGELSLLKIRPGAVWDRKATTYRLSDITRVDVGGDYEDALYIVGGEPPLG